ncbi:MAG TPA: response regulator [Gemmatimonadales bacterium]|nr:response regulator [Gemmatimonadales bacterium]
MSPPRPDPEPSPQPSQARRTGLRAALAALETARAGLDLPEETEEAEDSARRIVRALKEGGALEGRSELALAADKVLEGRATGFHAAVTGFTALLARAVDAQAARTSDAILIIEDDSIFNRTLASALKAPGRRLLVAESAASAREILKRDSVTLIVLDLILPDGDGRNILLELRSDPRTAGLPVFVMSARFSTRTKSECFALGADAYFEKPLDIEAFSVAVGARLERYYDQAQAARRDPVTGLPNRAAFLEAWGRLRDAAAENHQFALAVLDLDHFRWIEETWGRQVSDNVLRRAAIRLALALRQAAVFARWDGAEFIALFAGRSAVEAGVAVDQALTMLRRVDFRPGGDAPLTLTFSAGVVDVPQSQPMEEAIALADRLRYLAKASGRNRVVAGEATVSVPTRRILLAEDDPDITRMVTRHLRREGFEVVAYGNGEEALANMARSGAALVISDIQMPKLDGLELLRAIRSHPELRHIPVMMLTAMGDESYIVRAFELGADDYVIKPFSMREVTARVRRLLRRPSVAGVPVT